MKTCPNCGTSLNDNEKFCKNCGAKQPETNAANDAQDKAEDKGYQQDKNAGYTQNQSHSQNSSQSHGQSYGGGYYHPQSAGTNGLAIASLVLGIVTWIFGWFTLAIPGIIGIIMGGIAMSQCKKTGKGGYGMAVAGLVLSIIQVVIYFIIFAVTAAAYATAYGSLQYFF